MLFVVSIWILVVITMTRIDAQASQSSYDTFNSSDKAQVEFYTPVSDSSVKAPSYVASIRVTATGQTYCSGILVSSKYVLTSALCAPRQYFKETFITGTDSQYVAIGSQSGSGDGGQQYKIVGWTKHPLFTAPRYEYNFMLLELEKACTNTPAILAPSTDQAVVYNSWATVLGWGAVKLATGPSSTMQKTNVTVIQNSDCNKTETVYTSNFCAMAAATNGEYQRDSCRVDIGSPLIKSKGDVDYAVGILSYSFGCGHKDTPMVFSSVDKVTNWIQKVTSA